MVRAAFAAPLLAVAFVGPAAAGCLAYEPATVTLTGTITRHLEYGAPGFGEDPAHDARETYWYLDLDQPVCVDAKPGDALDEAEAGIGRLQIVYAGGYPAGEGWIDHRASITGTLFHAISGHHHTPVLIRAMATAKLP